MIGIMTKTQNVMTMNPIGNDCGLEGELEGVKEGWQIADDGAADWAVRKIKEARANRDRMIAHFEDQIEKAIESCRITENFFSGKLIEYFNVLPVRESKTQKSYELPTGKLILKFPAPEYVRDESKLVEWLFKIDRQDLIRTDFVSKPIWSELKPLTIVSGNDVIYLETGEVIPGLSAVERGAEFKVEV